ncbi:MAG TPA: regulatory signaling modulator protein AmpE [Gammaproteobacteria bacterium]|nr:regulatory signaling modulator protein AmpE [Gammaproteobacteria bacterium]
MTFLAILAALAFDRLVPLVDDWRVVPWPATYTAMMREQFERLERWGGVAVVLVLVAPPLIVTGVLLLLLQEIHFLLGFLFALIVLIVSLGPRELTREVEAYAAATHSGDEARARALATALTGEEVPSDAGPRSQRVAQAIFVQANDRLFGVLFWFALTGPLGAILYRMTAALRGALADSFGTNHPITDTARRLHGFVAWLPARLLALSYALAGSFEDAMADWKAYYDRCSPRFFDVNDDVLACAGGGALRMALDEDEAGLSIVWSALGLVNRALIAWLVVIGFFTLVGLLL